MTLEAILDPLHRIEIVVPPSSDSRRIFSEVAALYDNRKVELTAERHIIVTAPTGLDGGYISGEVFGQLREWAKRDGSGKPFDSSSGFYISPEENRSPDASWVSNERIAQIPKADRKASAPFARTSPLRSSHHRTPYMSFERSVSAIWNAQRKRCGSLTQK